MKNAYMLGSREAVSSAACSVGLAELPCPLPACQLVKEFGRQRCWTVDTSSFRLQIGTDNDISYKAFQLIVVQVPCRRAYNLVLQIGTDKSKLTNRHRHQAKLCIK